MATKTLAPVSPTPDDPRSAAGHLADDELLAIPEEGSPSPQLAAGAAHLAHCRSCAARAQALRLSEHQLRGDNDEGWAGDAGHARARARLQERLSTADGGSLWPAGGSTAPVVRTALAMAAAAVLIVAVVGGSRLGGRVPSDVPATMAMRAELASYRDALPDRSLTPGATVAMAADELCRLAPQEPKKIPEPVRVSILRAYGMENLADNEYELDYLITPDLGGAPDPRNLWPEPYASPVWNARVKDELEDLLPQLVCEGQVDLATAQREIAADWVAAYKKYFKTDRPLRRS